MARRVYVHVGLPKTGTTYLQHMLWESREALAADGVLFPGETTSSDPILTPVLKSIRCDSGDPIAKMLRVW